jgi:magnesium transporter
VVTVKDLLLAHDQNPVDDLMETDLIAVQTTDDQEYAATLMATHHLISLPVVDAEYRLVGIVTVDDAVDVLQEEATEDFEKMAAMAPSEKPYLKTSVLRLARNRFVWLLVLMASGMITGGILGGFEEAFQAVPLLVTFMPMLTDTGGNAGSQSSTLVIRGMALGEIAMADAPKILWKELRVSLAVALPLVLVNLGRIVLFNRTAAGFAVGVVVSLAMLCTVVMANSIGGLLPVAAKKLRIDPAIMAAPLITTIVDALSLIVYFGLAMVLLGI